MNSGFTHESTYNESKEWYTPPSLFRTLDFQFSMDVCSPGAEIVPWIPANEHLTIRENGLTAPWRGTVWMNPPYGTDTPKWMRKLARHNDGIALVFARTDTLWFHTYATTASTILFLRGRLRFQKPDGTVGGTPGSGSMLIAFGTAASTVLYNARSLGHLMVGTVS